MRERSSPAADDILVRGYRVLGMLARAYQPIRPARPSGFPPHPELTLVTGGALDLLLTRTSPRRATWRRGRRWTPSTQRTPLGVGIAGATTPRPDAATARRLLHLLGGCCGSLLPTTSLRPAGGQLGASRSGPSWRGSPGAPAGPGQARGSGSGRPCASALRTLHSASICDCYMLLWR